MVKILVLYQKQGTSTSLVHDVKIQILLSLRFLKLLISMFISQVGTGTLIKHKRYDEVKAAKVSSKCMLTK